MAPTQIRCLSSDSTELLTDERCQCLLALRLGFKSTSGIGIYTVYTHVCLLGINLDTWGVFRAMWGIKVPFAFTRRDKFDDCILFASYVFGFYVFFEFGLCTLLLLRSLARRGQTGQLLLLPGFVLSALLVHAVARWVLSLAFLGLRHRCRQNPSG